MLPASPFSPRRPLQIAAAVLLCLLSLMPRIGQAQVDPGGTGEITITARYFGVGGVVRPGEWVGIRLQLTDIGDRQRDVLIRVMRPDPDGDRTLFERIVTTNPGITQPLWVYLPLSYRFRQGEVLNVVAHAAIEQVGPGALDSRWMFVPGRVLGTARLSPRSVIPKTVGAIGVVGSRQMGLTRYAGVSNLDHLPTGHERSEVIHQLDADALPDRWFGLSQFSVIVWNEPPPSSLGLERAEALREWVMRGGGHLVIVLPRLGQSWTDEINNPLFDIIPRVAVRRLEGVDLAPYAPIITRTPPAAMPRNEIVHTFIPLEDAEPHEAILILNAPASEGAEGESEPPCIVVRRIVGTGMVTMIGLDVASRWMAERGLPEADLFWHRILGRRGDLAVRDPADLNAPINIPRDTITLDRDVASQIAKTGRAAAGVLIGFVVFIAYWLVAGPVGYAMLRRRGWSRHGWVAFVLAAGVFTGIAWGGATAIKPHRIEASHLTFLDHVYGQPVQRTRTWASLLVPEYGEAAVALGDPLTRGNSPFRNVIAPWEPDGHGRPGFPDARDYRIDSRSPDHVVVPVRATVKQFQMEWAGGPRWPTPRPVGHPDGGEPRIRLVNRGGELRLEGTLVHDLPAPMKNIHVIVVAGQRDTLASLHVPGIRSLLSNVHAVTLPEWAPGTHLNLAERIDLSQVARGTQRNPAQGEQYLRSLLENLQPDSNEALELDSMRAVQRYTALALFSQLEPPDTRIDNRFIGRGQPLAQRKSSHNWDLGAWFTQPCLIIIGHVGDSSQGVASPTPIFVSMQTGVGGGGPYREIPTSGRTVVRWIYPLGSAPPRIPVRGEEPLPEEAPEPPPARGRGTGGR